MTSIIDKSCFNNSEFSASLMDFKLEFEKMSLELKNEEIGEKNNIIFMENKSVVETLESTKSSQFFQNVKFNATDMNEKIELYYKIYFKDQNVRNNEKRTNEKLSQENNDGQSIIENGITDARSSEFNKNDYIQS